jgi:hypothetical protein
MSINTLNEVIDKLLDAIVTKIDSNNTFNMSLFASIAD